MYCPLYCTSMYYTCSYNNETSGLLCYLVWICGCADGGSHVFSYLVTLCWDVYIDHCRFLVSKQTLSHHYCPQVLIYIEVAGIIYLHRMLIHFLPPHKVGAKWGFPIPQLWSYLFSAKFIYNILIKRSSFFPEFSFGWDGSADYNAYCPLQLHGKVRKLTSDSGVFRQMACFLTFSFVTLGCNFFSTDKKKRS